MRVSLSSNPFSRLGMRRGSPPGSGKPHLALLHGFLNPLLNPPHQATLLFLVNHSPKGRAGPVSMIWEYDRGRRYRLCSTWEVGTLLFLFPSLFHTSQLCFYRTSNIAMPTPPRYPASHAQNGQSTAKKSHWRRRERRSTHLLCRMQRAWMLLRGRRCRLSLGHWGNLGAGVNGRRHELSRSIGLWYCPQPTLLCV